jgi:hypothetical protein
VPAAKIRGSILALGAYEMQIEVIEADQASSHCRSRRGTAATVDSADGVEAFAVGVVGCGDYCSSFMR